MTYLGVVYFNGPKTKWDRKIDDGEVISRRESKHLWLIRWLTISTYVSLDPSRCGYAILQGDEVLEHVEAKP